MEFDACELDTKLSRRWQLNIQAGRGWHSFLGKKCATEILRAINRRRQAYESALLTKYRCAFKFQWGNRRPLLALPMAATRFRWIRRQIIVSGIYLEVTD